MFLPCHPQAGCWSAHWPSSIVCAMPSCASSQPIQSQLHASELPYPADSCVTAAHCQKYQVSCNKTVLKALLKILHMKDRLITAPKKCRLQRLVEV